MSLAYGQLSGLVDQRQSKSRRSLSEALDKLRKTGRSVITKSDLVIKIMKASGTVQLFDIYNLSEQDELLGDVSINIGGLSWAPGNESLGMLEPSLNPAASCTMNFSAIYTRTPKKISWLLDIYTSQFTKGLLRANPPKWNISFYSASTYWMGSGDGPEGYLQDMEKNKLVRPEPFLSLYSVKASLEPSINYSFSSDALQTASVTYYSEDVLLNIEQMF